MKTRTDFVSNSSSCSFVLAINKEYDTSTFAKDLAKACAKPKAACHDRGIANRNRRILDFCLNTYELAFLGIWKLRTDETVLSKEDHYKMWNADVANEELSKRLNEEAEHAWQHELDCIEKAKSPNCESCFKKHYEKNYIDQEGKLHKFNDVTAKDCILDADAVRHALNRYGYGSDDDSETIKLRVEKLRQVAEDNASYECCEKFIAMPHVQCYAITMNTIKNTRDLLKAGISLVFGKHENLDELEKRIEAGEKLFAICIGWDGEGYGCYQVYAENSIGCLDSLAVEILHSELM